MADTHTTFVGSIPPIYDRCLGSLLGLVEGNPVYGEIMERRPDALESIKAAVASNIAAELGDHPVRCRLRALVFQAERPSRPGP